MRGQPDIARRHMRRRTGDFELRRGDSWLARYWIALVVVAALAVMGMVLLLREEVAMACDCEGERTPAANVNVGDKTVTYEITAQGAAFGRVSYLDEQSNAAKGEKSLPWSTQIHTNGRAIPAGVLAGSDEGSLQCRILVDGEERARDSAAGPHAVVSCNLPAV
ncbi:MmpS family transport accessory protein [Nocardia transvalensis]|uniref:MmpS family transport accessory protein n=1 Tax=Nocardia transvalensis TaxID=37333 RepID=UPI0018945100|nr:MmpS family transport accessory protein [Nocardia transvalensis]MBF6331962.1 hypothetical protein [Nocardia transvalensis]